MGNSNTTTYAYIIAMLRNNFTPSPSKHMRQLLDNYKSQQLRTNMNQKPTFRDELELLLNSYNKESKSDTPDYILAKFLLSSMKAFSGATKEIDNHYNNLFKEASGIIELDMEDCQNFKFNITSEVEIPCCFTGDTLLLTTNGYKRIESLARE